MGFLKGPKGPSAQEIAAREEKARKAERARIEKESAQAETDQRKRAAMAESRDLQKRQAFAGQLAETAEDQDSRKRFLKGI